MVLFILKLFLKKADNFRSMFRIRKNGKRFLNNKIDSFLLQYHTNCHDSKMCIYISYSKIQENIFNQHKVRE